MSDMPRIEAATVAEHNVMRRRQVVDAAVEVLTEKGVAGLHPAAVAARTGLARSTMYQYYPSTQALLGAAVEAMLAAARDRALAAVAGADTPVARVTAYLHSAMAEAQSGHGRLAEIATLPMPEVCREGIRALHEQMTEPLRQALAEAGTPDPGAVAGFVNAVVNAVAVAIRHGAPPESTIDAALRFALAGAGLPPPDRSAQQP